MKKLSKLLSILLCLTMILGIIPVMASAEDTLLAQFDFPGSSSATTWADGNDIGTGKSYQSGDYTLSLTNCSKVYGGGYDANGKGFIKFGTSSKVGTLTFTVPDEVTSVVLHLSGYKSNTAKYTINGGTAASTTKTSSTVNGTASGYDEVTIDTTNTKTITLATTSSGKRMVMFSVLFYGQGSGCSHEYDNCEDATCNLCDEPRTAPGHKYASCDSLECIACDHIRENGDSHTYTTSPKCDACGYLNAVTPLAGYPYKLVLAQNNANVNKVLYFAGETDPTANYRLAGDENADNAVDVYLEAVTDGYLLYFMNGETKTYIRIYERSSGSGSLALVTEAPAEVLTYNSEYRTLVYKADETNSYYLGTYNTYTTFSVSKLSFMNANNVDVSQFPARFVCVDHSWNDATCTTPKTCKACGTTEGEALGHDWDNATCTTPKTCKICNATEGEALGHKDEEGGAKDYTCDICGAELCTDHDWADPTCTTPKTCKICGEVDSTVPALGHKWINATCTDPKTCEVCQATEGEALGHKWANATCTAPKTCETCNATEGEALGHDMADATCTAPKTCKREGCNHTEGEALGHKLNKVAAKEATTEAAGNKEHWVCETCEKLFADAEGKTETTKEAVTIAKLPTDEDPVFTKVTSLSDIVPGSYVIVAHHGDKYYVLTHDLNEKGNKIVAIEVTVEGNTVVGENLPVWTVAANGTGISLNNGTKYLSYTGKTNLALADEAYLWNLAAKETDDGSYKVIPADADSRGLSFRNDTANEAVIFGAYALSNENNDWAADYMVNLEFYKLTSGTVTPPADDDKEEGGNQEGTPGNPEPPKSETVNASTAVAGEKGTIYTVKGVVTLLDGQNVYVQDSTGGICVRLSTKDHGIKMGDTIVATGKLDFYNGLPQLASATFEKSEGLNLWASKTSIDKLTTAHIGTYINLTGVKVVEIFDNDGQYTNPNVTVEDANGNRIQIYKAVVGKNADGSWAIKVGDTINLNAAVSIYKETLQLRNTYASEIVDASSVPATGDASLISVFVALLAVSGMGLTAVVAKKKEF